MGDSRGCRGGLRRGLRRCRAAPPLPLVVLPPDGVSTLRYARGPVPPKRRAAALIGFALFPLPPRPLRGSAAPPCARWPPSSVASGGGVVSRQPPLSSSRSGGASAQPPSPPASLCAGSQGRGACFSGLWPPRRCGGAPLRSGPAPPVLAPGRDYFVFAAAGLGIAPPAGGAKGLPSCTRCAIGCGVHGFAMNPCDS